jgi:hypothetical protein
MSMIRRLLSLLAGALVCWALYVLAATFLPGGTPTALLLGASEGARGFFYAAVPALVIVLIVNLIIAKIPLFRRAWMTAGALVIAAALCLFALLFFGSALLQSGAGALS